MQMVNTIQLELFPFLVLDFFFEGNHCCPLIIEMFKEIECAFDTPGQRSQEEKLRLSVMTCFFQLIFRPVDLTTAWHLYV